MTVTRPSSRPESRTPPSTAGDSGEWHSSPPPAAILFGLSLGALAWMGPDRALVAHALAPWTAAFLALAVLWKRHPGWLARPGILLGGALLIRILFLLPVQDLSDDLFRYVWDGWLGVNGVPPYRHVPADPALLTFQGDTLFRAMNSPGYHSVYPPLSQWVFLPGGQVHEWVGWPLSGRVVRVAFTALEFVGILALHRALRRTGRSPATLALYAWNPLALLTVAGSGHTEGGLVLALGLFLLGVSERRAALAWTGWVLAVLSKGIPLLLAPLAWRVIRQGTGTRAAFLGLIPALALAGVLSLPFLRLDDLPRAWSSAELYVSLFEFNAGLHALLRVAGWEAAATLRWIAVAGALWIGLRHAVGGIASVAAAIVLVFSLYLVTATTVHPWYLLWILPLLPFTATGRHPWLWGSWAAFATYLFYVGVPAWPLALLFWGGMLAWWVQDERERFFRPLRRLAGTRKARWVAPFLEGATLLDVGGAEGWVSRALAKRSDLATVVLSPVPGKARAPGHARRGSRPGVPPEGSRTTRVGGDARALPFRDGAFDTVLLGFVLHHVDGPEGAEGALREALRVAARRVVILESTWKAPSERRVLRRLDAWVNAGRERNEAGHDRPPHRYPEHRRAEEWVALAEFLGARIVHADRPPDAVHRVLRLVLEPGIGSGGDSGRSEVGQSG